MLSADPSRRRVALLNPPVFDRCGDRAPARPRIERVRSRPGLARARAARERRDIQFLIDAGIGLLPAPASNESGRGPDSLALALRASGATSLSRTRRVSRAARSCAGTC